MSLAGLRYHPTKEGKVFIVYISFWFGCSAHWYEANHAGNSQVELAPDVDCARRAGVPSFYFSWSNRIFYPCLSIAQLTAQINGFSRRLLITLFPLVKEKWKIGNCRFGIFPCRICDWVR